MATDEREAKRARLDGDEGGASADATTTANGAGERQQQQQQQQEWFVGSIDQGTTSSRFIIFDTKGEPVAGHQIEFENLYPESG